MLREFLYVDTDKVRSLLAQMDGGVIEEVKTTEKKQGNISGGIRNVASREQLWGTEESAQRSLADAVFPTLEDTLQSDGYLVDVSDDLRQIDAQSFADFCLRFPPGSFLRITAPARLFDARYVAKIFSGIGATVSGIEAFTPQIAQLASRTGASRPKTPPGARPKIGRAEASPPELEDFIPEFDSSLTGDLEPKQLRALVKLARGLFHPGLHVAMSPRPPGEGVAVTARLQEGRRFLDSEPEILFARYGVQEQEWTMVGTVGTYSVGPTFEQGDVNFLAGDKVSRAKIVAAINNLLETMGTIGMADLPQYPGLSIVPFAVYRPILREGNIIDLPSA